MNKERVVEDLARLQRNRGLQSADLGDRVGPALSQLTGFDAARGADARASLVRQLVMAAQSLPPDLRLVFARASATRPDDKPTLGQRLDSVGAVVDRHRAVVRRRLAEANGLVADVLLSNRDDDRGWFVEGLDVEVDLREPRPVYIATMTGVVTATRLTQLVEKVSRPGDGRDVALEFAVSGQASLDRSVRTHPQTWEYHLSLERPFTCGEAFTYVTKMRLDSRTHAPPMSVMQPRRDVRSFATTVHLGDLADQVWVLDGAPAPSAYDDVPSGRLIDPHREPSPRESFTNLLPGLVYGLRWRWRRGAP